MTATTLPVPAPPAAAPDRGPLEPRHESRMDDPGARGSGSATRAGRARSLAEARAATRAATAELGAALAAGESSYRQLAARLDDFDRRVQEVRRRLATRAGGSRDRVPASRVPASHSPLRRTDADAFPRKWSTRA